MAMFSTNRRELCDTGGREAGAAGAVTPTFHADRTLEADVGTGLGALGDREVGADIRDDDDTFLDTADARVSE